MVSGLRKGQQADWGRRRRGAVEKSTGGLEVAIKGKIRMRRLSPLLREIAISPTPKQYYQDKNWLAIFVASVDATTR
jgi:hypothetical protein